MDRHGTIPAVAQSSSAACVMQDAILPPVANRRWSALVQSYGRVNNPPQANSLHHGTMKLAVPEN
ncbi:MAG TPA: hypothetical protein VKU01_03325 [Bryobacteraceae bacterium]|nr:hypothetical protein [Bryobacteraceae bacterium]